VAEELIVRQGLSRETAHTLAAIAEGSIGRALLFHELDLLPFRHEMIEQLVGLIREEPETIPALFLLAEKAASLKENLRKYYLKKNFWTKHLSTLYFK